MKIGLKCSIKDYLRQFVTDKTMDNTVNRGVNKGMNHQFIDKKDDEIDLSELIILLWKKKNRIFLATLICGCIGLLYAIQAPEQWTASAVIYQPKLRDTLQLDQLRNALNIQGLNGTKNNDSLYKDFFLEFNSYNNINDYLKATTQFKEYVAEHNLSELAQQRLLRTWSAWMKNELEDKKGEQPGIRLSFSFYKRDDALSMLTGYINYVIELLSQEFTEDLENNKKSQINTLNLRMKLMTEDAMRKLAREIESVEYSMSIANAAGVNKPLENFSYGDRFPITLGEDALVRKLAILKSLKIEEYMPEIAELGVQLARLDQIKIGDLKLSPFSYLDTPSQPLRRDKPKRPLIVILATMLGGMFGIVMVLIQHTLTQAKNKKIEQNYDYPPQLVNARTYTSS